MLYLVVFVPDKYFNSLNPIFYIHVSLEHLLNVPRTQSLLVSKMLKLFYAAV